MMNKSCDALGYSGVPNPTSEELDGILDAIAAESKESGLDQRFLLAIMVRLSASMLKCICTDIFGTDARVERLRASKIYSVAWR